MANRRGAEYRQSMVGQHGRAPSRYRHGSPLRDPDVLHVLTVGALVNVVGLGLPYLYFLARTWRTARRTGIGLAPDVTTVMVFGKRLVDGAPDREYRWRLRRALHLLRRHPALTVLLAGGASEGEDRATEAEIGRDWLLRHLPQAAPRVRVESRSLDTIDNLRQARALLPPGPVGLLSSRYHLARCVVMARSLHLTVRPCAAEPRLRLDARGAGRLALEAGYHTLFVIGRRWARLIGHARMLSRVS